MLIIGNKKTKQTMEATKKLFNSVYQAKGWEIVEEVPDDPKEKKAQVFKQVNRPQVTTATRTVPVKSQNAGSAETTGADQIAASLGLNQGSNDPAKGGTNEITNQTKRSTLAKPNAPKGTEKGVANKRGGTANRN